MFDLFRSREKSVRYLLGALLTLVAASMVITLVPGYGGGWGSSSGSDPSLLAEIGDEKVTALEVRQFLQREMKSTNIPKGMEGIYIPMIVQQMTAQKAVAFQAARMGLKVTDEQLATIVKSMLPMLWEGGKFAGKEAYASILAQQNMSIQMFESNVRAQAQQLQLEMLAMEGVVVTPQEVEDEYKRRNEKIKVAYFGIDQELTRKKVTAAPAEIAAFFEKNKANYQLPERRSYLIFPVEEAKIAESIKLPEDQLKAAYAQQQERFRTTERVRASHILLKTTDKQPAEVALIEQRMKELLAKAKGGADFADLAKKNSDDPGSAAKGGDLDWIVRGQTVPEFEKAAFSAKPGTITDIVKTQYGFHILKIVQHEQARLRPFEEVKGELTADLVRAQVFDKMQALADQIRSALVKSRDEAEKLAAANGITPVKAENVAAGDPVQEVGVNEQFTQAVAGLPKNGVSTVIQIGQNKLVVAQVIDILAVRPAQLADVESRVKDALLNEKAYNLMQELVKDANAKVKAGGDLAALAKNYGAEVKTSELVTREGAIAGLGAASSINEAYSKNVGDLVGPLLTGNGTFYVKVVEKQPADLTQLAANRTQMLEMLKRRKAQERSELFRDGLVQELIKQKKVKIYEDNIRRLSGSFGG